MDSLKQLLDKLAIDQRLRVTVWSTENEELEFNYDSKILDMDTNKSLFLISPPPADRQEIMTNMEKGVVVGIVVEINPNPLIFYPIIHSHQHIKEPQGTWLQINANSQVEIVQRRRHVRIPMQIPIHIEYQGPSDKWIAIEGKTEDLSGGGLRITSSKRFHKDQRIIVHLQLSKDSPAMKLKAKVMFTGENGAHEQTDDLFFAACQFVDLTDAQEMLIVRECFRRELEMRKGERVIE